MTALKTTHPITNATVRLTDTATGAVSEEKTSSIVDAQQFVQFLVPGGAYTAELITSASSVGPSQTLWWSGSQFVTSRSAASPITVVWGSHLNFYPKIDI